MYDMAGRLPHPGGEPRHFGPPLRPAQDDRGLMTHHAVRLQRARLLEGRDALHRAWSYGRPGSIGWPLARPIRSRSQSVAGPRAPRRTGSSPGGGRQRSTNPPFQNRSISGRRAVTTRSPKRSVASEGVSAVRTPYRRSPPGAASSSTAGRSSRRSFCQVPTAARHSSAPGRAARSPAASPQPARPTAPAGRRGRRPSWPGRRDPGARPRDARPRRTGSARWPASRARP